MICFNLILKINSNITFFIFEFTFICTFGLFLICKIWFYSIRFFWIYFISLNFPNLFIFINHHHHLSSEDRFWDFFFLSRTQWLFHAVFNRYPYFCPTLYWLLEGLFFVIFNLLDPNSCYYYKLVIKVKVFFWGWNYNNFMNKILNGEQLNSSANSRWLILPEELMILIHCSSVR